MSIAGKVGAAETLKGRINLCDLLVISAYAIAVKNGFEGTEEEWLASLEGEPGISSIYILDEGEGLENVPEESAIAIDPNGDGEDIDLTGYVKSVNGVAPDEDGDVSINVPSKTSELDNDSGFITAEDVPASSGSGIHIGNEPPTNPTVDVWIDTDEEPEESGGTTPDWNASGGEPGYVQNRTHYKELVELVNGTLTDVGDGILGVVTDAPKFVAGKTYFVTYNGTDYTCTAFEVMGEELMATLIGNGAVSGLEDTGEPFSMFIMDGVLTCFDFNEATEATVHIVGEKTFPISHEYLPSMSCVIDVEEGVLNLSYDTTHLVKCLRNGWPVWLNITGGVQEKRIQVTTWHTLQNSLDFSVSAYGEAAVQVFLYGCECSPNSVDVKMLVLNGSD